MAVVSLLGRSLSYGDGQASGAPDGVAGILCDVSQECLAVPSLRRGIRLLASLIALVLAVFATAALASGVGAALGRAEVATPVGPLARRAIGR